MTLLVLEGQPGNLQILQPPLTSIARLVGSLNPARKGPQMSDLASSWQAGLDQMAEVYGDDLGFPGPDDDIGPGSRPYVETTVVQLFGDVWSRPGLSVRDRRLLVMGVTAAFGQVEPAVTQMYGALVNEELTPDELGEAVLQLAFYAGWPNGRAMRTAAERAIDRYNETS
jgi:4-carboxymuconolactone decarboxylase